MKKLTFLLFALVLNTAMAEEVGYEVEVIIFEDITGRYVDSENWIDMQQRIAGEEYIEEQLPEEPELDSPAADYTIEFEPGENQLLKDQVAKLLVHPEFKVHVHKVWKQPGLDRDMAVPFEINSQEQLLDPALYLTEEDAITETENQEETDKEAPVFESYVEGNVTLIMSRYLHFNTNLTLHRSFEDNTQAYPIASERRMRSRETHFIDHPMVGVIVIATPFKILTEDDKNNPIGTYRTL